MENVCSMKEVMWNALKNFSRQTYRKEIIADNNIRVRVLSWIG
jgi:hypothetical protein